MSYTTVVKGADANCGLTLLTDLNTIMLAAGYTNTSDSPWTSAAKTAYIWKSASVDNGGGTDFYIIGYTPSNNSVSPVFMVGEYWDSTNHKLRKYVPANSNLTPNAADNYCVNDATGVLPDSATLFSLGPTVSTTGYQYWISCNINRLVCAARVATTDTAFYVGQTTNQLNTTDFPSAADAILLCRPGYGYSRNAGYGINYQQCGFTRDPGQTASAASNFSGTMPTSADEIVWPRYSDLGNSDWWYKPGWYASLVPVYENHSVSGGIFIPRVFLKDVYGCGRTPTTTNGDTLTIDEKTCVKMSYGSVKMFVDNAV